MYKVIQGDPEDKAIIDIGLHDYFGNKVYISVLLGKFQACIGKNPYYKQEQKRLKDISAFMVIPSKWLEVIDFKPEAIHLIRKYFNVSEEYLKEKLSIWNS